MARTAITPQQIARTGLASALATPDQANGNTFANDGQCFLYVKNAAGSPITVTIATPGTVDGLAIADLTVSVPATTGERMIGPFPPGIYNQSDGTVYVDWSSATSVTAGVFRL